MVNLMRGGRVDSAARRRGACSFRLYLTRISPRMDSWRAQK